MGKADLQRLGRQITEFLAQHPACEFCEAPAVTVTVVESLDGDGVTLYRLAPACGPHARDWNDGAEEGPP